MSQKSEKFLEKAEEAEASAAAAKDAKVKRGYLDIARQWREMAARAERQT